MTTLIIDVDGVLTDGKVYYSESGERQKAFHSRDIPAIKRLKEKYRIVLLTASTWQGLKYFADRCGVEYYTVKDKAQWALENCEGDIISVIDSYDDIALANVSRFVFIPSDASIRLKNHISCHWQIMDIRGGDGVADGVERLLTERLSENITKSSLYQEIKEHENKIIKAETDEAKRLAELAILKVNKYFEDPSIQVKIHSAIRQSAYGVKEGELIKDGKGYRDRVFEWVSPYSRHSVHYTLFGIGVLDVPRREHKTVAKAIEEKLRRFIPKEFTIEVCVTQDGSESFNHFYPTAKIRWK